MLILTVSQIRLPLLLSFQNLHKVLLHVDVDRAIAGEGAAGHVAAGNFDQGLL